MKTSLTLALSLIFLLLLFFLSTSLEAKLMSIEQAKKKNYGEWVKVRGHIKWKKSYSNFLLLKICDNTDCIFALSRDQQSINIDDYVEVIGKINRYKEKQIVIEEIKRIEI